MTIVMSNGLDSKLNPRHGKKKKKKKFWKMDQRWGNTNSQWNCVTLKGLGNKKRIQNYDWFMNNTGGAEVSVFISNQSTCYPYLTVWSILPTSFPRFRRATLFIMFQNSNCTITKNAVLYNLSLIFFINSF